MSEHVPVKVGQEVPEFTMETYDPVKSDFSEVSLKTLKSEKKWVILVFYPADFTFVCPTELADVAEKHEEISNSRGEIISVSTDTKFVHLAWHRDERLLENVKYQMGADPTGKISRMFGVYDEEAGIALRGTFIISPEGKLVSSEVNYFNVGRNSDELLRKFNCNTYLSSHSDEACPAKWKEGEKTLTPSAKMVGKVYEEIS